MKYTVKTIALLVRNNRIAKFGEVVEDLELTINPMELVKSGAIELVASDNTEVEVEENEVNEVAEQAILDTEVVAEEVVVESKPKAKSAFSKANALK